MSNPDTPRSTSNPEAGYRQQADEQPQPDSQSSQQKAPHQQRLDTLEATSRRRPPDAYGAAVIDEEGREIPITEAMIDQALKSLEP